MYDTINFIELGGTLFIPATHKNLEQIVNQNKYPALRSILIDFEDGLDQADLETAYKKVERILQNRTKNLPYAFIRPRDEEHLKTLLEMKNIERVNGFILPKFSLTNGQKYFQLLERTNYLIMPSIEGNELFSYEELHALKELLLTNKHKIVLVRFGLEDMLRQLNMRRSCDESIFDFSVGNVVLGNFISLFKSAGLAISGGVYPCFENENGFKKDILRDLKEGLFSKTIIHPNQIEIINELYKVDEQEYQEALELINSQKVVFEQNGKMAEKYTMSGYAEFIRKRAEVYGVRTQ